MFRVALGTGSGVCRSKFVHAPGSPLRGAGTARCMAWLHGLHWQHACISANEKNHIFKLVFGLFLKPGEANQLDVWMAVLIASSH
jgi:hypothetical protein